MIDAVSNSLETDYMEYFDTPQFQHLGITVRIENLLLFEGYGGQVGRFILSITASKDNPADSFSLKELKDFLFRCSQWIWTCLGEHDAEHWLNYVYPVLVLWDTSPVFQDNDIINNKNNLKIISDLMFGAIQPNLKFTPETLSTLISLNLGYLETKSVRLSPYAALIYDSDYNNSKSYIDSHVVPSIANLRAIHAYLEYLNKLLNKKLDQSSFKRGKKNKKDYNELFLLRESAIRALSTSEYSSTYLQLTKISETLVNIFHIDKLENSLEKKIEVLHTIFEKLLNDRISKLDKSLSLINLALAGIGALLALQLPPIVHFFSGK
jgi:hypothetical protein